MYLPVPLGYWSILLDKIDQLYSNTLDTTMVYFILKTQSTSQAIRIFYLLKQEEVPDEEQKDIIHLNCKSVRRINGISNLMTYLDQNTSNAMHETEPYIMKKLSWNQAVDMFGFDYESGDEGGKSPASLND